MKFSDELLGLWTLVHESKLPRWRHEGAPRWQFVSYHRYRLDHISASPIMTVRRNAIIIGAGVAGLAAADWLCQMGHSTLILESRSRLGGRIHSLHVG